MAFISRISGYYNNQDDDSIRLMNKTYTERTAKYIQLVSNLKKNFAEDFVELPQVVFCGNQSAGKTSLLEAIANVQLPRRDGTCTRCVMEIRMQETSKTSGWECSISLRVEYDENNNPLPDARRKNLGFGEAIHDPSDVHLMAYRAQKALLNPSTKHDLYLDHEPLDESKEEEDEIKFTMNTVCLSIKGPNVPNLSLVDLPGIVEHIRNVDPEVSRQLVTTIKTLARNYVKNQNSIIVATIPCKEEDENQSIHNIINEVDRHKKRTVFVLTKPDRIEPETHGKWIPKLQNSSGPDYFVVMNPNQEKLNKGVTFTQAREEEKQWFENTEPWCSSTFKDKLGVKRLRTRLENLLIEKIRESIPEVTNKISNRLKKENNILKNLPPPPLNAHSAISNVTNKCKESIRHKLENTETELNDKNDNLWEKMRGQLNEYKTTIKNGRPLFVLKSNNHALLVDVLENISTQNCDKKYDSIVVTTKAIVNKHSNRRSLGSEEFFKETTNIKDIIDKNRAHELPSRVPYKVPNDIIKKYQRHWKEHSTQCLEKIFDIFWKEIEQIIRNSAKQYKKLCLFLEGRAKKRLESCKERCEKLIELFSDLELKKPYTEDDQITRNKSVYQSQLINLVPNDTEAATVVADVKSYYELSLRRYTDYVCMTIIYKFVFEFSEDWQNSMISDIFVDDTENANGHLKPNELIEEDPAITDDRDRCEKDINRLKKIKKELEDFKFSML
ncbi:6844_t:CDS:2 [Paraglomus occultum]|uniref:6844_t:CDS:1 n=1 Tax=Paraglomus occultum TaxID=144539 RepID=A0A9N9BMK0_9GLOM|nr:6844_t:CDS:2 [Paraglomus occultum]